MQYLKSRPDDSQTADSLRFLLSAMNALKRRNPLTESFLVQLDVDLEALSLRIPKLKNAFPRSSDSVSQHELSDCFSWFLTRPSQDPTILVLGRSLRFATTPKVCKASWHTETSVIL